MGDVWRWQQLSPKVVGLGGSSSGTMDDDDSGPRHFVLYFTTLVIFSPSSNWSSCVLSCCKQSYSQEVVSMSTILRTFRNLRRIGIKEAWHQVGLAKHSCAKYDALLTR